MKRLESAGDFAAALTVLLITTAIAIALASCSRSRVVTVPMPGECPPGYRLMMPDHEKRELLCVPDSTRAVP